MLTRDHPVNLSASWLAFSKSKVPSYIDGTELSRDEIRADQLTRIREASASAKWVAAAAALHQLGTLHADLTRTIDPQSVWGRVPGGRDATLAWHDELATALGADFTAPILTELGMLREEVRSL